MPMHPLVRDLYKRVLLVGRDYPLGLAYVKDKWKAALRNPENCPSCYVTNNDDNSLSPLPVEELQQNPQCEKEIRQAVGKGRFMVREMIGVIQLKKYRTMNKRYGVDHTDHLQEAMKYLELEGKKLFLRKP